MTPELLIRPERPADHGAVEELNRVAFGQPAEAALVAALRPLPGTVSLVAEREGAVVGHLLLSAVEVQAPQPWAALALAPMAVAPELQRCGIGSALVRGGLEAARAASAPAVIVLGHPDYYPRFGFEPAGAYGLSCKWPVPPEAYLVLELQAGWLEEQGGGEVRYAEAFDGV